MRETIEDHRPSEAPLLCRLLNFLSTLKVAASGVQNKDIQSQVQRSFQVSKFPKFKSTVAKRNELIHAILDQEGFQGMSAEEWLEEKNIKLEDLTDSDIDKLLWMIKEANEPKDWAQAIA